MASFGGSHKAKSSTSLARTNSHGKKSNNLGAVLQHSRSGDQHGFGLHSNHSEGTFGLFGDNKPHKPAPPPRDSQQAFHFTKEPSASKEDLGSPTLQQSPKEPSSPRSDKEGDAEARNQQDKTDSEIRFDGLDEPTDSKSFKGHKSGVTFSDPPPGRASQKKSIKKEASTALKIAPHRQSLAGSIDPAGLVDNKGKNDNANHGGKRFKLFRAETRVEEVAQSFHIRTECEDEQEHTRALQRMFPPAVDEDEGPAACISLMGHKGKIFQSCLTGLAFATLVFVPWQIAFESSCRPDEQTTVLWLKVLHLCCSTLYSCLALVVKNFISMIDPNKSIELLNVRKIFLQRLKTHEFWFNVAATLTLPLEVMHLDQSSDSPTWGQYCMLLSLLRIVVTHYGAHAHSPTQLHLIREVSGLLFGLLLQIHLIACVWGLAGFLQVSKGKSSVFQDVLMDPEIGCGDYWATSMYFTAATVITVGYGDISPIGSVEQILAICSMVLGQMALAQIFAELNWLTSTHNHWRAEQLSSVTQMAAALESMSVPVMLKHRVLAFQAFTGMMQKERAVQQCFDQLSPSLRTELRLTIYHTLITRAPFFRSQPLEAIKLLVHSLSDRVHLPHDFIFGEGEPGEELFFVRNGEVSIVAKPGPESNVIATLSTGDYFGEIAVLTGRKRVSWALSCTYTVLSVIHRDTLECLEAEFPGSFVQLIRSVKRLCNLQPSIGWDKLAVNLAQRFQDSLEVFDWLVGDQTRHLLTAAEFQNAIQELEGITQFDAKLLWADLDTEDQGSVNYDWFCEHLEHVCKENDLAEDVIGDLIKEDGKAQIPALTEDKTVSGDGTSFQTDIGRLSNIMESAEAGDSGDALGSSITSLELVDSNGNDGGGSQSFSRLAIQERAKPSANQLAMETTPSVDKLEKKLSAVDKMNSTASLMSRMDDLEMGTQSDKTGELAEYHRSSRTNIEGLADLPGALGALTSSEPPARQTVSRFSVLGAKINTAAMVPNRGISVYSIAEVGEGSEGHRRTMHEFGRGQRPPDRNSTWSTPPRQRGQSIQSEGAWNPVIPQGRVSGGPIPGGRHNSVMSTSRLGAPDRSLRPQASPSNSGNLQALGKTLPGAISPTGSAVVGTASAKTGTSRRENFQLQQSINRVEAKVDELSMRILPLEDLNAKVDSLALTLQPFEDGTIHTLSDQMAEMLRHIQAGHSEGDGSTASQRDNDVEDGDVTSDKRVGSHQEMEC